MKTIGITGGIGAGKSMVLHYIQEHYPARIYKADEIANYLKEPGQSCYRPIVGLLGEHVLSGDGTIDKNKMAELIFTNPGLLEQVNAIIHPAVKDFVIARIEEEKNKKEKAFFIFEAALLIEEGYDEILDELWYVRAEEKNRSSRLQLSRQYSGEKIQNIMRHQLGDEAFIKYCKVVIDNNRSPENTYKQIDDKLGEYISAESK